jgi:hypothetical protein
MKKIEGKLRTFYQKNEYSFSGNLFEPSFKMEKVKTWNKFEGTVNKVRASDGYEVKNFRKLNDEVALVTLNNKSHEMFYRGQVRDYKNNSAKYFSDRTRKSVIMPSICRPDKKVNGELKYSIRKKEVQRRYRYLYNLIDYINSKQNFTLPYEHYMSLFQHYEIAKTPLIDITQSLRVAATFALKKSKIGYLYVFGLPFPNQSISYYTDLGIILLKLQNVVSVNAIRPRYQEGYLVGNFPFSNYKSNEDDLANRMVAKFKLTNEDNKFWDKFFQPIPEEILFPKNDKLEAQLKAYKIEFDNKYQS